VNHVFPIQNASGNPRHEYSAAEGWVNVAKFYGRATGNPDVGLFHSHPNGTVPSEQDMKACAGRVELWVIHHAPGSHTYVAAENLRNLQVELAASPTAQVQLPGFSDGRYYASAVHVDTHGRLEANPTTLALMKMSDKGRAAYLAALSNARRKSEWNRDTVVTLGTLAEKLNVTRVTARKRLQEAERRGLVKIGRGEVIVRVSLEGFG